jgi:pimeloyl-ACP methyl ester carboxylesterase
LIVGIRKHWPLIRRIWITVGLTATVAFVVWSLIAYRANAEARAATATDSTVTVVYADGVWRFNPAAVSQSAVLIFFPGALVDPRAYAPLARSVAEAGYQVILVELPRRGAFGGAESPELRMRIAEALSSIPEDYAVVVGGHSRGGVVASSFAAQESRLAGVVLIGTSHPRDADLSGLQVPVTKIVGTRDGLASPEEVNQNAGLLPAHARWVWVEGGNHSQFGWYGFQPMDRRPRIPAAQQRAIMTRSVVDLMQAVDSSTAGRGGR